VLLLRSDPVHGLLLLEDVLLYLPYLIVDLPLQPSSGSTVLSEFCTYTFILLPSDLVLQLGDLRVAGTRGNRGDRRLDGLN
jgi:hypothetical protein